jgi:nitroreductase
MLAVDALLGRVSCGKLQQPAPTGEDLAIIQGAALRAADHAGLTPWRFLVVQNEGLKALGELYLESAKSEGAALSDAQCQRYLDMPQRAPMVIVAIAAAYEHAKVPASEQLLATGAAVQNMLTAAFALGVGAYWRTGPLAYSESVRSGLGVAGGESIVGFIYMGTPAGDLKVKAAKPVSDFFRPWPSK